MAIDLELNVHKEWIGYVQPVGLVASPPALVAAQAFPAKNIIPDHTRFLDLVEQVTVEGEDDPLPAIRDFPRFARQILGWEPADLVGSEGGGALPESLEVALTEYNETLRPSYAVPEFDKTPNGEPKWLMLIKRVKLGLDLDATPETDSKDHHWQASPQARFERLAPGKYDVSVLPPHKEEPPGAGCTFDDPLGSAEGLELKAGESLELTIKCTPQPDAPKK